MGLPLVPSACQAREATQSSDSGTLDENKKTRSCGKAWTSAGHMAIQCGAEGTGNCENMVTSSLTAETREQDHARHCHPQGVNQNVSLCSVCTEIYPLVSLAISEILSLLSLVTPQKGNGFHSMYSLPSGSGKLDLVAYACDLIYLGI